MLHGMWKARLRRKGGHDGVEGKHELVNKLIILEQRGRSLNKEIRGKIPLPRGDSVIAHITESMND